MQRFLAVLMIPVLSVLLAVPHAVAGTVKSSTPTKVRTASATPTDSQLEAAIHTKLAKSKIGKDGFRFHVQHGVVTWEGSTNVVQHKGSATRMARSAGAVQVVNNIQVSASGKARASANLKRASIVQ